MGYLADLPSELLSNVLAHSFRDPLYLLHPNHYAIHLSGHLVSWAWYSLARRIFFEKLIHETEIRVLQRLSEEPMLHHYDVMRGHPMFARQVRNLKMFVNVQDEREIDGAVHEAEQELKQYSSLRRLHLIVPEWKIEHLVLPKLQIVVEVLRMSGVRVVLGTDNMCEPFFDWA